MSEISPKLMSIMKAERTSIYVTYSQKCSFGNGLVYSLPRQVCESVFPINYNGLERFKNA